MQVLKVMNGFVAVVSAGARATVYAVLAALLLFYAGILLRAIFLLDLKSLLLWLLFVPFLGFLFWIMLLRHSATEIMEESLLQEADQSSRELFDKVLTPTAFTLGFVLLFWLLVSRRFESWWFVVELVIGYFLAPTLIRKRLLARLLESHGSD